MSPSIAGNEGGGGDGSGTGRNIEPSSSSSPQQQSSESAALASSTLGSLCSPPSLTIHPASPAPFTRPIAASPPTASPSQHSRKLRQTATIDSRHRPLSSIAAGGPLSPRGRVHDRFPRSYTTAADQHHPAHQQNSFPPAAAGAGAGKNRSISFHPSSSSLTRRSMAAAGGAGDVERQYPYSSSAAAGAGAGGSASVGGIGGRRGSASASAFEIQGSRGGR